MNLKFLSILFLVLLFSGSLEATENCSPIQLRTEASCSFQNTSAAGEAVSNVTTVVAPSYTYDDLLNIIYDPSTHCASDCINQVRNSVISQLNNRRSNREYERRIREVRRSILVKDGVDKLNNTFQDWARTSEALRGINYVSGSQMPDSPTCDLDQVESTIRSCMRGSRSLGSEIFEKFKDKLLPTASMRAGVTNTTDVFRYLTDKISNHYRSNSSHLCEPGSDNDVMMSDYYRALGQPEISNNEMNFLNPQYINFLRSSCIVGGQTVRSCVEEQLAKSIFLQNYTGARQEELRNTDVRRMMSDKFQEVGLTEADRLKLEEALSRINNPLLRPFIENIDALERFSTLLRPGRMTTSDFLTNNFDSLGSFITNYKNNSCNRLKQDIQRIVCVPESQALESVGIGAFDSIATSMDREERPTDFAFLADIVCSQDSHYTVRSTAAQDSIFREDIPRNNITLGASVSLQATGRFAPYETSLPGFMIVACNETPLPGSVVSVGRAISRAATVASTRLRHRSRRPHPVISVLSETELNLPTLDLSSLTLDIPQISPSSTDTAPAVTQTSSPSSPQPLTPAGSQASVEPGAASVTSVPQPLPQTVVPVAVNVPIQPLTESLTVPFATEVDRAAQTSISRGPASVNNSNNNEELLRQVAAAEQRVLELNNAALERRVRDLEAQNLENERLLNEERSRVPSSDAESVIEATTNTPVTVPDEVNRPRPSLSSGGANATPPRVIPSNAVSVSEAISAPIAVSNTQNTQSFISDNVIASGGLGLDGNQSARAARIRRSVTSGARTLQIRRDSSGGLQISNEQGEVVTSETPMTDQDILAILSDINSNPEFRGVVKLEGERLEIVVGERRIVLDTNQIQDRIRRLQISALSSEISIRQTRRVQNYFAAELSRRLTQVRTP